VFFEAMHLPGTLDFNSNPMDGAHSRFILNEQYIVQYLGQI